MLKKRRKKYKMKKRNKAGEREAKDGGEEWAGVEQERKRRNKEGEVVE